MLVSFLKKVEYPNSWLGIVTLVHTLLDVGYEMQLSSANPLVKVNST